MRVVFLLVMLATMAADAAAVPLLGQKLLVRDPSTNAARRAVVVLDDAVCDAESAGFCANVACVGQACFLPCY